MSKVHVALKFTITKQRNMKTLLTLIFVLFIGVAAQANNVSRNES